MNLSKKTILFVMVSFLLLGCSGDSDNGKTNPVDFKISGIISGLASGKQVTLLNNGRDELTVTSNTSFTFATPVVLGGKYNVTIKQPADQVCDVRMGKGTNVTNNITDINIVCGVEVLHSFGGKERGDGALPRASIITDGGSNFYGTTFSGGNKNFGTIFKLNTLGEYSVLHSFTGTLFFDGLPSNPLVLGNGLLYGTTPKIVDPNAPNNILAGGSIFEMDPNLPGSYGLIYRFNSATPEFGINPSAGLTFEDNSLYGVTSEGGLNGGGTLFEINFTKGTYSSLHNFSLETGAVPNAALRFLNNILYGTTTQGGLNGSGTIFSFNPTFPNTYAPIFNFTDNPAFPTSGGLIPGKGGLLYGMTAVGGKNNAGTIFSIDPTTQAYQVIHDFGDAEDGENPIGGLTLDLDGYFYGVTASGGTSDNGTLFRFNPTDSASYQVLISFNGENGKTPAGTLVLNDDKHFYGATVEGGAYGLGTIFRY